MTNMTPFTVGYRTVVNASHIEEAYLQHCSSSSSYGHILDVHGKDYYCPTTTGVVVHYASGRTSVYGGDDANTLWTELHGTPAYVDPYYYRILEDSQGLKIKIRGDDDSWAYDWVQVPVHLNHDELAEALLRLLWVHNYVDTEAISCIEGGTDEATFTERGVGIRPKGGNSSETIFLMECSYTTN